MEERIERIYDEMFDDLTTRGISFTYEDQKHWLKTRCSELIAIQNGYAKRFLYIRAILEMIRTIETIENFN